jgi:hypothetical protein
MKRIKKGKFVVTVWWRSVIGGICTEYERYQFTRTGNITLLGAQRMLRKQFNNPYLFVQAVDCLEIVE